VSTKQTKRKPHDSSRPKPIVLTTIEAPPMKPLRSTFPRPLVIPVRENGRIAPIDLNKTYLRA